MLFERVSQLPIWFSTIARMMHLLMLSLARVSLESLCSVRMLLQWDSSNMPLSRECIATAFSREFWKNYWMSQWCSLSWNASIAARWLSQGYFWLNSADSSINLSRSLWISCSRVYAAGDMTQWTNLSLERDSYLEIDFRSHRAV